MEHPPEIARVLRQRPWYRGAAIVAVISVVFGSFVTHFGPIVWGQAPSLKKAIECYLDRKPLRNSKSLLSIAVAQIGQPDTTRSVVQSIRAALGASILRGDIQLAELCNTIEVSAYGDVFENQKHANLQAKRLLNALQADLIVWGDVGVSDRLLQINTLAEDSIHTSKAYRLSKEFDLPDGFQDQISSALSSLILRRSIPEGDRDVSFDVARVATNYKVEMRVSDRNGGVLTDNFQIIAGVYNQISRISAQPIFSKGPSHCEIQIGRAFLALDFEVFGRPEYLEELLPSFEKSIEDGACEFSEEYTAIGYQLLGDGLIRMDSNMHSLARHPKAIALFRALLSRSAFKAREPNAWATTENNLGAALLDLARARAGAGPGAGEAYLDEARRAFQTSIASFERLKSERVSHPQKGLNEVIDEILRRSSSIAYPKSDDIVVTPLKDGTDKTKSVQLPSAPQSLVPILETASPQVVAPPIRIGLLTCDFLPSFGLGLGSNKSMRCVFMSTSGRQRRYSGALTSAGIDLGGVLTGKVVWGVYALSSVISDDISGRYHGDADNASILIGLGRNVFVGNGLALQPLDQAQVGLNFAIGSAVLALRNE